MNKVTLKLSPRKGQRLIVEVDGVRIPPSEERRGRVIYSYETESENANIRIYTEPNELVAPHWALRLLLYYFISIFGLFDWAYSGSPYIIDYVAEYRLSADTLLDFRWDKSLSRVFVSREGRADIIDNDTNVYTIDKRIKRRYVGMILLKVASWIAIFAMIILIVVR